MTVVVEGGVSIEKYTGPGGEVLIPPTIGGRNVARIGVAAFERQEQVTKVVIPKGVTSIGMWSFSGCSSLKSVEIPEVVTCIGRNTFSGCSNMTSLSIPESVESIGEYAFSCCPNLPFRQKMKLKMMGAM